MKKYLLIAGLTLCSISFTYAQSTDANEQANYTQVITKRSEKIVTALNITDSVKFKRVVAIIVDQYRDLSAIHDTPQSTSKRYKIKAG